MDHKSIISDWQSGKFDPIYLLHGEEEYFIDELVHYAEKNILNEAEKSFNQITLYGKEINFQHILDQAYQFPMMSSHRVIILKEAQSMRDFDKLESYFQKPCDTSILIIAHKHGKVDKRKKVWKSLNKTATEFESKKVYDNKIPGFINSFLKEKKLKIEPRATELIITYVGNSLTNIINELNKVVINIQPNETISLSHIEKYIGISKDYNIFEFLNVIGSKNIKSIYRIAHYFGQNSKNNPIQMIIPSMFGYFQKLSILKQNVGLGDRELSSMLGVHPFFLKDYKSASRNYTVDSISRIFGVLNKYDQKSKGIDTRGLKEDQLLKEMIFQVIH